MRLSAVRAVSSTIDRLSEAGGVLSGVFVLLMSAAIGTEIVLRYFFNQPTLWSLEISIYLLIMSAFLAAGYVMKMGAHVRADFLVSKLVSKTRSIFEIVTLCVTLVFCGLVFWYGMEYAMHAVVRQEVSESVLRVPLWIPRVFVPLGMFLLILQTLKVIFNKVTVLRNDESELSYTRMSVQNPFVLVPLYLGILAAEVWLLRMNPMIGAILLPLTLLFSGVPVAFGLGLAGVTIPFFLGGEERTLYHSAIVSYGSLRSFTLAALPLYIIGASVISKAKVGEQLYDLATKWVGHFPGGLAVASVVACGLFGAISGSSVAAAVTIGLIAIPAMIKRGYDKELAYGTLAISGTLASMIPPSLGFLLYGSITDVSVGQLFMGGVFPGVMEICTISVLVAVLCRGGRRHRPTPSASWKERLASIRSAFWAILAMVIVLVGIYSGVFTATEAAAVLVIYAFVVGMCILKSVRLRDILPLLREGVRSSTMILMIVVGALLFGHVLTLLQIPQGIMLAVTKMQMHPWAVMIMINILVIILGMILDGASLILLTVPVVFPIIVSLGFDPLWFGVVIVANGELGLITPPVAMNIFAIQAITGEKMSVVIRGTFPFMLLQVFNLILIIAFPPLATWLPRHMIR